MLLCAQKKNADFCTSGRFGAAGAIPRLLLKIVRIETTARALIEASATYTIRATCAIPVLIVAAVNVKSFILAMRV